MKMKNKVLVFLLILILLLAAYDYRQCFYAKKVEVDFQSEKVKRPLKITQISDFHSNKLKNLPFVLDSIRDFRPDFIILTGDINDFYEEGKTERALAFIDQVLSLKIKTYYILGNHEEAGPGLSNREEELRKRDLVFLKNQGEVFDHDGDSIYIYGTGSLSFSLEGYRPGRSSLNLLLSHFPMVAVENPVEGTDFIFSGHTHGGQVRLPFLGAIWAPGGGFFPTYQQGAYKLDKASLYIDSGLGNTGFNLRFLNPVQFTNLVINPL